MQNIEQISKRKLFLFCTIDLTTRSMLNVQKCETQCTFKTSNHSNLLTDKLIDVNAYKSNLNFLMLLLSNDPIELQFRTGNNRTGVQLNWLLIKVVEKNWLIIQKDPLSRAFVIDPVRSVRVYVCLD